MRITSHSSSQRTRGPPSHFHWQARSTRLFDVLLGFCLIPEYLPPAPLPLQATAFDKPQDIVHGDIRGPNLTVSNRIIDFEFLGFDQARAEERKIDRQTFNPEICLEQCRRRSTTVFTNVWQCGLVVFQMTGEVLATTKHGTTSVASIFERAQTLTCPPKPDCLTLEFFSFLVQCRKEMCNWDVFRNNHTLEQRRAMRESLGKMRETLRGFLVLSPSLSLSTATPHKRKRVQQTGQSTDETMEG